MNTPFEMGLIAAAGLVMLQPALAKKGPVVSKQPPIFYRLTDDPRCIERSFSISVGNPAYKNRLSIWPAPCSR
jgi:hypothetical protein